MTDGTGNEQDMGGERDRKHDGAGNTRPLPGSEARRGNEDENAELESALDAEPAKSAIRNQSSVKPEDYKKSTGGGSANVDRP